MMKESNFERIDKWFDAHRKEIIKDIKRIVKFPSVSRPVEDGYPFGKDCKDVLEEMLQIGREHGFHVENYEDYVGSIGLKKKNMSNTIGFWNHLDVVPVGNNWQYEPFEATLREPFLIGRGVGDNKGPAIGMLYLMQCLRELEIPMKHELCLFVGCDEEKGMRDMEYYVSKYETPAISIVPDSGFPVCYGEKGIIEGEMITKESVSEHITMFKGGVASNMIPDRVSVTLQGDEEFIKTLMIELDKLAENEVQEKISGKMSETSGENELNNVSFDYMFCDNTVTITYRGISRHSAFPYGSKNAIHGLCKVLSALSVLPEKDMELIAGIERLSCEYLGEVPRIAYKDEISGDTTCAATMIDLREGKLCLTLNIRYAITADNDKDLAALAAFAEENDLIWDLESNSKPNYFPKENPIVDLLTDVFNKATGEQHESYVMGGGTYARKLPNAFAYGLGGVKASEEDAALRSEYIRPGHGGAHEPDETLNLNTYMQGLKIFARAIIELNDVELYRE